MTLNRKQLLLAFRHAFTVPLLVIASQIFFWLLGWVSPVNIVIWTLGFLGIVGVFFLFDKLRLDVFVPPEEDTEIEEEEEEDEGFKDSEVRVESTTAQMEMFSFNDVVTQTFGTRNAEKMSELIVESDRHRLEEIM
jgi:hypothetical protein